MKENSRGSHDKAVPEMKVKKKNENHRKPETQDSF